MDEQTGKLFELEPELLEKLTQQIPHVHAVPGELESLAEQEIAHKNKLMEEAAVAMTGQGELSQWRQDLARQRRNKKRKARARCKANKRRKND